MSYALISDVHSNLEALLAVLEDIKKRRIRGIYFLGDAVGYGPNPDECLDILMKECAILLAGNHDWGVAGLTDIQYFNVFARAALEWTQHTITETHINLIKSFVVRADLKSENSMLVHGSPDEPEKWHYILYLADAEASFSHFDAKVCYIGHSHRPFIVEKTVSGELLKHDKRVSLKPDARYLVNVGSVGQPRDGDARASYVAVNGEHIEIIRIGYDIKSVQAKMKKANLPLPLIERLSYGM